MRNDFREGAFLCHGKEWKNHKYVAKVKLSSGKWFYFYDTSTYQNYLKKQGNTQGQNAKANPNKELVEKAAVNDKTLQSLISKGIAGKTTAEKTTNLKNAIATGTKKIQEALNSSSKKSSKSGSSASKSKSSSIAGKSKGSSGSSSSKGSKASGSSKAASSKEKSSTAAKTSSTSSQNTSTTTTPRAFDSAAAMKLMYGIKDEKVNKYDSKEAMLENMKSYDDNSYGYLTAKNTTYRWEKEGGEIKLYNINTDSEVSIDEYLKDVSSIQEFRTDNIKRKSKYRK